MAPPPFTWPLWGGPFPRFSQSVWEGSLARTDERTPARAPLSPEGRQDASRYGGGGSRTACAGRSGASGRAEDWQGGRQAAPPGREVKKASRGSPPGAALPPCASRLLSAPSGVGVAATCLSQAGGVGSPVAARPPGLHSGAQGGSWKTRSGSEPKCAPRQRSGTRFPAGQPVQHGGTCSQLSGEQERAHPHPALSAPPPLQPPPPPHSREEGIFAAV